MQGSSRYLKQGIYEEMLEIAQKKNLTLYINQAGLFAKKWQDYVENNYLNGNIWAQDNAAFILNKEQKTLIWSNIEPIQANRLADLMDFNLFYKKDIPRGGNYYIGFKPDKTKWMIISSKTVLKNREVPTLNLEGFRNVYEKVPKTLICERFDIEPENLYIVDTSIRDLDELIRPIEYPYVLVNSSDECIKNINKLKNKYKNNIAISQLCCNMEEFVKSNSYEEYTEKIAEDLKSKGFEPIKIGGWYGVDINFINALAYKDNGNKISYITNSTRDSIKGLEYLENLFEEDLRQKVCNIGDVDFISGGKAQIETFNDILNITPYKTSCVNRNKMMSTLANYNGGIHCMTAEIPNFDRII